MMHQQLPPAGPPPAGSAIPPGWTSHWSEEHQQAYYVNTITGESSWTMPTQAAQQPQQPQQTPSIQRKPVGGLSPHISSHSGAENDTRGAGGYPTYSTQHLHQDPNQHSNVQFPPPPNQTQYPTPYSPPQQAGGGGYFPSSGTPNQAYPTSPYPPSPVPGPYQFQQQYNPSQGPGNPSQQYFSPPPTPGSHQLQQQGHLHQTRDQQQLPQYQPSPMHSQNNFPPPPQNGNQQHGFYPPPPGQANGNPQLFSPPISPGPPQMPARPQSHYAQATSKLTQYLSPQPHQAQHTAVYGQQAQQPQNQPRKSSTGMMGKIGSKFGQLQKTAGPGSTASPLKKWGTRAALGIGAIGALTLGIDGMDGSLFDGAAAGGSGFDGSAINAQEAIDASYVQAALEQQGQENALMLLDPPGTTYVQTNSLI